MMYYVYILKSVHFPNNFYTGYTSDLKARLDKHNNGKVNHTTKYKPWKIKTYIAFDNEEKAHSFEKYLKSHSGRAFTIKHL